MASIFAHNRILPNLKRRSRPTNKSDVSPAKAKPLHILPNVAEEDEYPSRHSSSSTSSLPIAGPHHAPSYVGCSATLGARPTHDKRDSRRVVLTGVEGITFDDFFPLSSAPRVRTPSPPPRPITPPRSVVPPPTADSPLDDINLRFSGLGISLDFPSPPSCITPLSPLSRRREQSPAPSLASSDASSSSPKTPYSTPPTSDDESPSKSHLMRAPTFKSQRTSVLYMKPVSDLGEPVRKSSITSIAEEDISEEVDWIAQDIGDVFTLASPLPSAFQVAASESSADTRARPDSVAPPPRRQGSNRSRDIDAVPVLPRISIQDSGARGPSVQLDPTFPLKRRSYLVPTRPPPPPPVMKSSSLTEMEQATEELLAELANAALGAGFLGTELTIPHDTLSAAGSVPPSPSSQFIVMTPVTPTMPLGSRPPPRSSVPADIYDFCDSPIEAPMPRRDLWPTTPQSASMYSQMTDSPPTSPLSSFEFDIDVSLVRDRPVTPDSPAPMRRQPSALSLSSDPERVLRSRWSTSTLGSIADSNSHSWLGRFALSPAKKTKSKQPAAQAAAAAASVALQRKNAVKSSHSPKRSVDSDRGVSRRDSRSSRTSESSASDSGDAASVTSSGLRRKPIPMALLSVSGVNHATST